MDWNNIKRWEIRTQDAIEYQILRTTGKASPWWTITNRQPFEEYCGAVTEHQYEAIYTSILQEVTNTLRGGK